MSYDPKREFSKYVCEISRVQRQHVTDRVEKLARHQSHAWQYFMGCVTLSTGGVLLVFKLWGPRHIFKNSMYYARPLPPAISMGIVLYGVLYTCRGMLMRNRICTMMEDYEYELKRISAHHCEEGVTQLAWLQFVTDQLRQGGEHSDMSGQQHESSVVLRFEKVVSYFLDGIPKPFVQLPLDVKPGKTFSLSRFGFLPDYTGQTKLLYVPEFQESEAFDAVCWWQCKRSSPSSRIGSHYSPYVGTFSFNGKSLDTRLSRFTLIREPARIPINTCEETKTISAKTALVFDREADCELRTLLLINLYAQESKEYLVHDKDSMRRIVVLATQGFTSSYRGLVESEIIELKNLYIRSCCQAIYEYLCLNSLFRRIVFPLCLKIDMKGYSMPANLKNQCAKHKIPRISAFNSALDLVKQSLFWNRQSNGFFTGLNEVWVKRFDKLVLFDVSTTQWKVDADVFLTQLGCSMRAAFTRLRVEFYTQVENLLFDKIGRVTEFLILDSKSFKNSDLSRIFLATRVLLTNRIRAMILDALTDLVHFFLNYGETVISPVKASKISVLEISLVIGGSGLPRSPSFAQLRFGITDLLNELIGSANGLPTPEAVIMRTVDLERRSLDSFDMSEFPMRALLLKYFDAAGSVIEDLSTKYSAFSVLPSLVGAYFTRTAEDNVKKNVFYIRDILIKISKASPDIVFFGRIAINCINVKRWYMDQWSHYLDNYLSAIHADVFSFLQISIEKSHRYNGCLNNEPQTVEELDKLHSTIKAIESLSDNVRDNECKQVINWFDCMENWQISIDSSLYSTALELMRCPEDLLDLAEKAKALCTSCRPCIIARLGQLRNDTRNKIKTINTGIVELLGMFSLEVCDIAAQTCQELRVVVDEVLKATEYIFYCEDWLEIDHADSFEDFVSVLNSFETLEQFWGSIFDSTIVKDYYDTSVISIQPLKMIDNVQRCRRLLHCSIRNLRSHSGLVSLGYQQEQVLADFESLEDFLDLITAPGLRKNHWKEITRLLQKEVHGNAQVDSSVSLRYILEKGILDHIDKLKSIVDPALIDFETESALEQMKSEAKKTRFIFEPVVGCKDAFVLSPTCRASIYNTLESFIGDCRSLTNQAFLSQFVVNSIREWEASCEKMHVALLQWKEVEQEWIEVLRYGMTLELIGELEVPPRDSREWKFLHEKIVSVNDIFSVFCATLQKRQYTLFTSISHENVYEQLTLASTILGDVKKVISSLLDAKREAFPRFCFLTDGELLSFLSVLDPTTLTQMLSKMYSRVCNVGIENNAVVSYLTSDGAVLKANEPIKFSAVPVERWMINFDKTLRLSLLIEIETCIKTFYHVDFLTWIQSSCSQVINIALRIMHYRDFCEVLTLAGNSGISAYLKRITDVSDDCVRLASGSLERSVRRTLFDSITFLSNCKKEVRIAMKTGVQTVEDLGMTAMLQTFMEKDKIFVQVLGLRLEYGFEYLGNYSFPVFPCEFLGKGLYSIFLSFAGGSFPLVIGKPEICIALHNYAEYLGRFWWSFQCRPSTPLESVMQALRGAISVGAIICLKDVGLVDNEIIPRITEMIQRVSTFSTSGIERREQNSITSLSSESDGPVINVKRHPCFQLVLTCDKCEEIPTALALAFRPIYLPHVDMSLVAWGILQALGFTQCVNVGQRFAAMYDQFQEVLPSVFNLKSFVAVIHNAVGTRGGSVLENLGAAFLDHFWPVIRSSNRLQKLLDWNATQTLGIPNEIWGEFFKKTRSVAGFDTVLERFSTLMEYNTNVMLVGPAFCGKTKLWKQWIRDMPFIVLSLRLLTCEDIYGSVNQKGILSSLAKEWNSLESRVIVVEDVDVSQNFFVFGVPMNTRVRPFEGPDFVRGPLSRVLGIASKLFNANPYFMSEFALFTLSEPNSWKGFLKEQLHSPPVYYASTAYAAIVAVIDALFETWSSVNRNTTSYENSFAVASRCSQFYKRWYSYAQSCCKSHREEWFTCEQAFALQCGVFATCWSLGLCLHMDERRLMRIALKKAHGKLSRVAVDIGFTEEVLPCMEDDIFQYVATPMGWRKLGGPAEGLGFFIPWSTQKTAFDLSRRTWNQFFALPSRESTLVTLELLINAGQPVLLHALGDEGKTTILRHLGSNERWVHHRVSGNVMSKASGIQESLLSRLSLRHSKLYGPPIGRKLLLCIDDVHLPGTLEGGCSQAMHLFSFINRHSALCPPSLGFAPVTDIVCVGASRPASFRTAVESGMMRVQLPSMSDAELSRCVGKFFEQACSSRRSMDIAEGVTRFFEAAREITLKVFRREKKHWTDDNDSSDSRITGSSYDKSGVMNTGELSNYDSPTVPGVPLHTNPLERDVRRESRIVREIAKLDIPFSRRHLFLRACDRAVQLLASSWIDRDALANIFTATCGLCSSIIDSQHGRTFMSERLTKVAEETLRPCCSMKTLVLDPDGAMSAENYEHDDTDLPPVTKSEVVQWFSAYDHLIACGAVEESPYLEPNASIVFAPPSQRAVADARIRRSIAHLILDAFPASWLATLNTEIHQSMRQDQLHVAVVGSHDINILHHAMRIWGVAARLHVALLRDDYPNNPTGVERFTQDLVEVLRRTCRNDGRMVLFVPHRVTTLPWAMGYVDTIVRSGDISQLFNFDDKLVLLYGHRETRRINGQLTATEALELHTRISRRLAIVLHIESLEAMTNLSAKYPFVFKLLPIPLRVGELRRELVEVLINRVITQWVSTEVAQKICQNSISNPIACGRECVNGSGACRSLMGQPIMPILCDIFETLAPRFSLRHDQLIEFSFQTQRLYHCLLEIRYEASRSRYILNLPSHIEKKSSEYEERIASAILSKKAIEDLIAVAHRRIYEQHTRGERAKSALQRFQTEASALASLIRQETEELRAVPTKIKTMLSAAEYRVRGLSATLVKAFAMLRLPEKGVLLVRAVCRVLGEELRHAAVQDIWNRGRDIMTAPKFIQRLAAIEPANFSYESLAPMHASLREVRYTEASPYASAVGDYILTFMEAVQLANGMRDIQARIEILRLQYELMLSYAEKATAGIADAEMRTAGLHEDLVPLREECLRLDALCDDMRQRQSVLRSFASIVEDFIPYHSFDEVGARDAEMRGEAAIIFAAARLALFGLITNGADGDRLALDALPDTLEKGSLKTSLSDMATSVSDSTVMVLFPSLKNFMGNELVSSLSLLERMCVGSVLQRTFLRWPLFAGSSPVFERVMRLVLFRLCGDVVVISALNSHARGALVDAARLGAGVLLCDVSAAMVLGELRPLFELRSCLAAASDGNETVSKCPLFGQLVVVRTSFLLVCLSPAVTTPEKTCTPELRDRSDDNAESIRRLASLVCTVNLSVGTGAKAPYRTTLLLSVGDARDVDDLEGTPKDEEEAVESFRSTLNKVRDLFCLDLDKLSENAEGEIENMEALIEDLADLHMHIERTEMHQQIVRSRVQDSWRYVELALRCVERALQKVEVEILGRSSVSHKVYAIAVRAGNLPRKYVTRIMPNTFFGLSDSHREFYVCVVLIERAVQMFACGWPHGLRGIFALYILSSVVLECELILRLRGELYAGATYFLNRPQFDVLHALLCRRSNDTDAGKEQFSDLEEENVVPVLRVTAPDARELYQSSSDALLREVAEKVIVDYSFQDLPLTTGKSMKSPTLQGSINSKFGSVSSLDSSAETPVYTLFKQWVLQDFDACDRVASKLYDAVFTSVKDTPNTDEENGAFKAYNFSPEQTVDVRCTDELALQCMHGGIPSFVRATNVVRTVRYFRQRASEAKLPHHIFHVTTVESAEGLMKLITECFSKRPVEQALCHRIIATIAPDKEAAKDAKLARKLDIILKQFAHYAAWGARRGAEHDPFPIFITFVMECSAVEKSATIPPPIRADSCAALLEDRCIVHRPGLSDPRFHLLSLVERRDSMRPWRPEGAFLVLDSSTTVTLPAITSPIIKTPKKSALVSSATHSRRAGRNEEAARLSNAIELHVGIVGIESMRQVVWSREGFGKAAAAASVRFTVDDDDLFLLLRLIAMWARRVGAVEEKDATGVKRTSRTNALQNQRQSLLDREPFNAQRNRDRLQSVLCKIAYGVYSARVTTERERLLIVDMISRVMAATSALARKPSVSLDDSAPDSTLSEDTFLTELRQSKTDILGICVDSATALAYRQASANTAHALLLGTSHSITKRPSVKSPIQNCEVESDANRSSAGKSEFIAAPSDVIGAVSLWETTHAERLAVALSAVGSKNTAARVLEASNRLRQWVPGDTLAVWFPALRHPQLLLSALAARAVSHKASGAEDVSHVEMVLVLLRRYSLLHDDVLLVGAALSEMLEEEVLLHTCWEGSELAWRRESPEPHQPCEDNPEDIVLALRFQRCRPRDTVEPSNELLWEVRSGEKRIKSALQPEPQRAGNPSVMFTMGVPSAMGAPEFEEGDIQTLRTLPVMCASPVVVQSESGHTGEHREKALLGSRVDRNWRLLAELPLLVSLTEKDWILSNSMRPEQIEEEETIRSSGKSFVTILDGSFGFFVSIS